MPITVRAISDFSGEPGTQEMSISAGELVVVTRFDVGGGWCEGKNSRGDVEIFPESYVELSPRAVFQSQKNCDSTDDEERVLSNDDYEEEHNTEGRDWEDTALNEEMPFVDNRSLSPENKDDVTLSSFTVSNTTFSRTFSKSVNYFLGLEMKDVLQYSGTTAIQQIDSCYHWQSNTNCFTVKVASPKQQKKFAGLKKFTAYQVTPSFTKITVFRRYKHFDWLLKRLGVKFPLIALPPLPEKQISGRYGEQFVEQRLVQLQEFVNWVCRHPILNKLEVLHHFLTCTDTKIWKEGKRRAEQDLFVGFNYCLAISPPENQISQIKVNSEMELFSHFVEAMKSSILSLLRVANDQDSRHQYICQNYTRIGCSMFGLAEALIIDERRAPSTYGTSLSKLVGLIGDTYIETGKMFEEQPKFDWMPFIYRLYMHRGILTNFPEILSIQKRAIQACGKFERLAAEQKISRARMSDVHRRTDVISYAVMAEMTHFQKERDSHLKDAFKSLIEEHIKFYTNIVHKFQQLNSQLE